MKKVYPFVLSVLIIIHFLFLHIYGIASFTTTLLFYYLVYIITEWITYFILKPETRALILKNIQVLLILLLILEFSLTFIFKIMNNYFENEKGIYFSEYKHKKQIDLLHLLGKKNTKIAWEDGYIPLTDRKHISPDFNYTIKINELGLRGELPSLKKDSNEYRIVVLGDSFIEGFGAPDDSSTFPVQLRKYLKNQHKKISVLNGGICGSNPIYEINLYHNVLKKYNPDLVIIETNMYDITDVKYAVNQNKMPVSEYFKAISHLFRSFYAGTLLGTSKSNTTLFINSKKIYVSQFIIQNLIRFRNQLSEDNKLLFIVYQPSLFEVTEYYDNAQPSKELQNAIHDSNIPFVDLKQAYINLFKENSEEINQYFWLKDGHHNPKGYDLMARTTAENLIKYKSIRESLNK